MKKIYFLYLALFILMLNLQTTAQAYSWNTLWQSADQQGFAALKKNQPVQAAQLFKDSTWRGIAHFKAQHYAAAEKAFATQNTALAHYNRGNALAYQGHYQAAISAYEQAISFNKDFIDAKFNRDLLKKYLDKQGKKLQEKHKDKHQNKSSPDTNKNRQQQNKQNNNKNEEQQRNKAQDQASLHNKKEQTNAQTPPLPSNNKEQQPDKAKNTDNDPMPNSHSKNDTQQPVSQRQQEQQQAQAQWLRQIPSTPPGLLRQKFLRDYQRQLKEHRL